MDGSPFETVIPREAELGRIIDRYAALPDETPCGLQTCRTKNRNGFIVSFLVDGAERIGAIGRDCGQKHFGVDWSNQERIFLREENQAALRKRLDSFIPEAAIVLSEMQSALSDLRRLAHFRDVLQTQAPRFFACCLNAIRARDAWLGRESSSGFLREFRIRGARFFTQQAPLSEANVLKSHIERIEVLVARKSTPVGELAMKAAEQGNIRKRWNEVTAWITAAHEALGNEHLEKTASYSERVGGPEIRLSKNGRWVMVYKRDEHGRGGEWDQLIPTVGAACLGQRPHYQPTAGHPT